MFTRVSTKDQFNQFVSNLRDALYHGSEIGLLTAEVQSYLEDLVLSIEGPIFSKNGHQARSRITEEFCTQGWTLDDYYEAFDPSFDAKAPLGDSTNRNLSIPLSVIRRTLNTVRNSVDLTEEDWVSAEGNFVASFIAATATLCHQAGAADLYGVPGRNVSRPHLRVLAPSEQVVEFDSSARPVLTAVS